MGGNCSLSVRVLTSEPPKILRHSTATKPILPSNLFRGDAVRATLATRNIGVAPQICGVHRFRGSGWSWVTISAREDTHMRPKTLVHVRFLRRHLALALIVLPFSPVPASLASPPAKNSNRMLTITSSPSGARVEFNGVFMGVTPLQLSYDKSFFEGKRYLWSKFLGEGVTMVTSAKGCDTDSRVITRGPITWDNGMGNVFTYYVFEASQFDVQLHCGDPADQPSTGPAATSGASSPSEDTEAAPSTVTITSAPTGCDISVDGKFMGSTPSTLKLPPGDHYLSVEKEGLTPWTRQMTVTSGGSVSINATLEAPPGKNKPKDPKK